jgi:2',3'-cyclic-nucleotide 2'-phosphodiesterase
MLKVLFVGDIVGASGRNVVIDHVSSLRDIHQIDLVIANAENAAHGKGLTKKLYQQLLGCGIDYLTMGNHTFAKADIYNFIQEADKMVRPINLEPYNIGNNYLVVDIKGIKLCIFNIQGNVFIDNTRGSCFALSQELLDEVKADLYFCDFHGEATSEKIAYAYHFKNQIHAIVGTHTHVQTADERLIEHTAFISDVGMCGAYESILGRDVNEALRKFVKNDQTRYEIADGPAIFCGVIITFDELQAQAVAIERIQIRP